jgi:hypothetical protein
MQEYLDVGGCDDLPSRPGSPDDAEADGAVQQENSIGGLYELQVYHAEEIRTDGPPVPADLFLTISSGQPREILLATRLVTGISNAVWDESFQLVLRTGSRYAVQVHARRHDGTRDSILPVATGVLEIGVSQNNSMNQGTWRHVWITMSPIGRVHLRFRYLSDQPDPLAFQVERNAMVLRAAVKDLISHVVYQVRFTMAVFFLLSPSWRLIVLVLFYSFLNPSRQ